MVGTCSGTINVTIPCTPKWVCEQPLNGYESDGCGNRRPNSACNPIAPYREARLLICVIMGTQTLNPGQTFTLNSSIDSGTNTENYKLVITGPLLGNRTVESAPFQIVGTPSPVTSDYMTQFTVPTDVTAGTKSFSVSLVKV